MADQLCHETCEQAFLDQPEPRISYGMPYADACRRHAESDYNASRIYIIASRSLALGGPALKTLEAALENRVAGVKVGMSQHTLMSECLEIMADVRNKNADLIVTLGGGTITDASKIIAYVALSLLNTVHRARLICTTGPCQQRRDKGSTPGIALCDRNQAWAWWHH